MAEARIGLIGTGVMGTTAGGEVVDMEVFVDCAFGYDVRAGFVCEQGTVSLNPFPSTRPRHAGHEGYRTPLDWRVRFHDAYRVQMEAWVKSIHGQPNDGASAWDGYRAMCVTEACLEAWGTGKKVEVARDERPAFYA